MKIGTFRRQVTKTVAVKPTKTALRTVSRNTPRTLIAQGVVALKYHTGELMEALSQYLLGFQQTEAMKVAAFSVMGDIGYDLTLLGRVLKVKLPSSTKKSKLVGTRAAALLQFDWLTTTLLQEVKAGVFTGPKMITVKKTVTMPQTGAQAERDVVVVDTDADAIAETVRQTEMAATLTEAVGIYWRLCFDLFGHAPATLLDDKFIRMQAEFPKVVWSENTPKAKAPVKVKAVKKAKAKAKAEPVTA